MENDSYSFDYKETHYNTCEDYVEAVQIDLHREKSVDVQYVLDYIVLPIIGIFGIVGNILNLVILSRKQINSSMDRMERSVYLGLIALAISDLLQCFFFMTFSLGMPEYVNPPTFLQSIHIFFWGYRVGLCNIVLCASTWFTVLMAVGRYVAICHPINARSFVKTKVTSILIVGITLFSVGISLPYFWEFQFNDLDCSFAVFSAVPPSGGCNCTISHRKLKNKDFIENYNIFWLVIEFLVPLGALVFCNVYLIMSLKQSYRMQREYRTNQPVRDPSIHITPTLIAVIMFFFIFIAPTEILKVINKHITHLISFRSRRVIVTVTNILQCLNAAVNFILYCVINVHFRKTIQKMFCCKEARRSIVGSMRSDHIRTNHTSVTYNMSEAETEL